MPSQWETQHAASLANKAAKVKMQQGNKLSAGEYANLLNLNAQVNWTSTDANVRAVSEALLLALHNRLRSEGFIATFDQGAQTYSVTRENTNEKHEG